MIKITQIDNGHQFEVQTQNGDTLLTSIAYMDKDKMDETIQNLLAVNANKNHFERRTNTEGKFIFSLKDDSGSTIGHSELYDSEAGMENGIKNLGKNLS
ncbi:hypothetical protein LCGC14_1021440 [marine sediment metagenome]|uniref:DUF1508 domain-containing protein n=2 Tax=root TaxID=1 RepID=A0A831QTE3_9FLAO|nr:DUF1508 domain-containing protein [Pricia antarctica]